MADLTITSPANPRLKSLVGLRRRRTREETGLTLVEGFEELSLALEAGVVPQTLYYCPELMLDVHEKGKAVVSNGTREKAEHDVAQLHAHGIRVVVGVCSQMRRRAIFDAELKSCASASALVTARSKRSSSSASWRPAISSCSAWLAFVRASSWLEGLSLSNVFS